MTLVISLDSNLSRTYMAHAALLAMKLLALSPITALTWVKKGIFHNVDTVRRAYLTELKIVSPFWVIGALYITTNPVETVAITLFRMYSLSRLVIILGYVTVPAPAVLTDLALIVSYLITFFMATKAIFFYWEYF